jgi:hypothetical protein
MIDIFAVGLPVSDDLHRNSEYALCLKKNVESPFIGSVKVVLEEHALPDGDPRRELLSNPKVSVIELGRRAKFDDFLQILRVSKGKLKAFSNADVHTDFSIGKLRNIIIEPNDVVAVVKNDALQTTYSAHDMWIFSSIPDDVGADFFFGYDHCDWAFADCLIKKGVRILIPVCDIMVHHAHRDWNKTYALRLSGRRTDKTHMIVPGYKPPYRTHTCRIGNEKITEIRRWGFLGSVDVLIVGLPHSVDGRRNEEYASALSHNLSNTCIREVVVIEEEYPISTISDSRARHLSSCHVVPLGRRATFSDYCRAASGRIIHGTACAANADIFFDGTLRCLADADLSGMALAVTREDMISCRNYDSQDAWFFKTPLHVDCDVHPGRLRCEHVFAAALVKAGLKVFNPCGEVKLHHAHASGIRERTLPDAQGPFYFPPVRSIRCLNGESQR